MSLHTVPLLFQTFQVLRYCETETSLPDSVLLHIACIQLCYEFNVSYAYVASTFASVYVSTELYYFAIVKTWYKWDYVSFFNLFQFSLNISRFIHADVFSNDIFYIITSQVFLNALIHIEDFLFVCFYIHIPCSLFRLVSF